MVLFQMTLSDLEKYEHHIIPMQQMSLLSSWFPFATVTYKYSWRSVDTTWPNAVMHDSLCYDKIDEQHITRAHALHCSIHQLSSVHN